jgi:tetratricopeptide (TPR) repeat protein
LIWELGPLATPNETLTMGDITNGLTGERYGAIRLFAERAVELDRNFKLDGANVENVGAICKLLDGVPLAIELAAAWTPILTTSDILGRLSEPLGLLVDRRQSPLTRHGSVAAAIQWSYDYLDPELQAAFARLSVFRGGWTAEGAEAVCQVPLGSIAELRNRSLLISRVEGDTMRFRMLHPIRAFAAERLEPWETERMSRSHAAYYLALTNRAEPELAGPGQAYWLDLLDQERHNLRAAIAFAGQVADVRVALGFGASLGSYWWTRGHWSEGRQHLESILSLVSEDSLEPELRAVYGLALCTCGWLSVKQGEEGAGKVLLDHALRILKAENHVRGIGRCLVVLGGLANDRLDLAQAEEQLLACLSLRDSGLDLECSASAIYALGRVEMHRYDFDAAASRYSEALSLSEEANDARGIAAALVGLGVVAGKREKFAEAKGYLESALPIYEQLGERRGLALTLTNSAEFELATGDLSRARQIAERALEIWRELGQPYGIADALAAAAGALCLEGDIAAGRARYSEAFKLYRRVSDMLGLARALIHAAPIPDDLFCAERALRLCTAAHAVATSTWKGLTEGERNEYASKTQAADELLGATWANTIRSEVREWVGNPSFDLSRLFR